MQVKGFGILAVEAMDIVEAVLNNIVMIIWKIGMFHTELQDYRTFRSVPLAFLHCS